MRKFEKATVVGLFVIAFVLFSVGMLARPPMGIADPAAVYCQALGYKFVVESTPEGDIGMCELPDGKRVSAWEFLQGKVAQEYSYCGQKGYQIKTVNSGRTCVRFGLTECAVCVLPDGREVEVTELMGLDFSCAKYRLPRWAFIGAGSALAAVAAVLAVVFSRRRRTSTGGHKEKKQKGNVDQSG